MIAVSVTEVLVASLKLQTRVLEDHRTPLGLRSQAKESKAEKRRVIMWVLRHALSIWNGAYHNILRLRMAKEVRIFLPFAMTLVRADSDVGLCIDGLSGRSSYSGSVD
jgi:hypothetical protein